MWLQYPDWVHMVQLEVHLKDQGSVTSQRALLCLKNLHEQKRGGAGGYKMMPDESRLVWSEHLEILSETATAGELWHHTTVRRFFLQTLVWRTHVCTGNRITEPTSSSFTLHNKTNQRDAARILRRYKTKTVHRRAAEQWRSAHTGREVRGGLREWERRGRDGEGRGIGRGKREKRGWGRKGERESEERGRREIEGGKDREERGRDRGRKRWGEEM